KLSWSVGQAAAYETDDFEALSAMITLALKDPTPQRIEFAGSLSANALKRFHETWPSRLAELIHAEALTPESASRLIFGWPETDETMAFVESLGSEIDSYFWSHKRAFRVKPDDADLLKTVHKYVKAGRPGAALDAASDRLDELTAPVVLK